MFGMLRRDGSESIEFVRSDKKGLGSDLSARSKQYFACKACREKKVRCTAQRSGCDRCKANDIACVYSKPSVASQTVHERRASDQRFPPDTQMVIDTERDEQHVPRNSCNTVGPFRVTAPSVSCANDNSTIQLPASPNLDHLGFQVAPGYMTPSKEFDILDFGYDMLPQPGTKTPVKAFGMNMALDVDSDFAMDENSSSDGLSLLLSTPLGSAEDDLLPSHCDLFPFVGSTILPSNGQQSVQSSPADGCSCLQVLAALLERLILIKSSSTLPQRRHPLDFELALHKSVISRCSQISHCSCYSKRSEHVMMLIVVCEHIVEMCSRLVQLFHSQMSRSDKPTGIHIQDGRSAPTDPRAPDPCHTETENTLYPSSGSTSPSIAAHVPVHGPPSAATPLAVGSFRISSLSEWTAVMRTVMTIQFQRTGEFLDHVAMLSSNRIRDKGQGTHRELLKRLRDKVTALLARL